MTYRNIETDHVKDFIRSRGLRDSTKMVYLIRINQYSQFMGKTSAEFIDEAEKNRIME